MIQNLKTSSKVVRHPKLSLEKKFGQIHPTVTEKSGSENHAKLAGLNVKNSMLTIFHKTSVKSPKLVLN